MEAIQFFQRLLSEIDIQVATIGKIVNYNKKTMMADVQPLVKNKGEQLPLLINIPTLQFVSGENSLIKHHSAGDTVIVLFLTGDSQGAIINGTETDNNSRNNNINDAIVLGGFSPLNNSIDTEDNEVFTIKCKDNVITISEDKIDIKGKVFINDREVGGIE